MRHRAQIQTEREPVDYKTAHYLRVYKWQDLDILGVRELSKRDRFKLDAR